MPDDDYVSSITVDFERGSPDPARVFRAMSGLIDSFVAIDRSLAKSVATAIEPLILLEDIESGSLRAKLRTVLRSIDDEALRTLDWKPLVGQYLVKAKHAILRRIGEDNTLATKQKVEAIQRDLIVIAHQTNVVNIHLYEPIPPKQLLENLEQLGSAVSNLLPTDEVRYVAFGESTPVNTGFYLTPEAVEDLLTEELVAHSLELILKIKKPDYLGMSMWEFHREEHPLQAKILDEQWLHEFQTRRIDVRPGDSLHAIVRTEMKRAADGSPVAVRHYVMHVLGVIQATMESQSDLFPPEAA